MTKAIGEANVVFSPGMRITRFFDMIGLKMSFGVNSGIGLIE
jgi:hypothetical protein